MTRKGMRYYDDKLKRMVRRENHKFLDESKRRKKTVEPEETDNDEIDE